VASAIDMDRFFDPGWFAVEPGSLRMREQQTRRVTVRASGKELRKLMERERAETNKSFKGQDIPLGTRLYVELVGGNPDNFQITPLYRGMEEQAVFVDKETTWAFDVTALKAGRKQRLLVRAWSTTDKFGTSIPPTARTVRDISELTVDVDVVDLGWWQRFKGSLTWVIGVLTGIAALYAAWRKLRHPQLALAPGNGGSR
jgi:hypothetical protein